MINKATLIGRVGKDPEIKTFDSGKTVASFSIATSRKVKGEEVTQWHNCKAWDKLAEVIQKYVNKGDLLYLEGEIQYDKKDDKTYTTINVGKMQMLGSKSQRSEAEIHDDVPAPEAAPEADTSDDLPF